MNKLKPFEFISDRFKISHESAKYFLGQVQKSFKTDKPPHKLIVEFIESKEIEYLLTPYELASLLFESETWKYALKSEPPEIVDDPDIF